MLKQLQEDYKSLSAKVQGVLALSDGKPGAMPADDQVKFEQMLADLDALKHSIELAEKAEAHAVWASTPNDKLRVAPEQLHDIKLHTPEEKHAFAKFITGHKLTDGEQKAITHTLTVGSDVRGGYLAPITMANDLIILLRNMVYIRSWARNYQITQGASIEVPVLTADVADLVETSEAASTGTDDTQLNFGMRVLTPRLREITVPIGRLMEKSSAFDIYNIVMESAAYSKATKEEKEFLTGNGANQAMGVFTESVNGFSTSRTVSTGTANVIGFDDFVNCLAGLRSQFRNGANWLIHRNLEGRVRKLKDSANNYVWSPVGQGVYNSQNLTVGLPGTILGFPYYTSENMTDPGITGNITTGTMVAILSNFQQSYAIADAIDMEVVNLDQKYYPRKALGFLAAYDAQVINENAGMRIKVS
jgi:HK97 family phage major capsid protein